MKEMIRAGMMKYLCSADSKSARTVWKSNMSFASQVLWTGYACEGSVEAYLVVFNLDVDWSVQWWNRICSHLKRWRQVWQLDRTEEGGRGQRETPLKIKKLDKMKLGYREWIQIWWTSRILGSFPYTWIEQSKNNSDQLSSRSNTLECIEIDN